VSRVASEASVIPSYHNHGSGPRRAAAGEAKPSPFAMLLDDAGQPAPPTTPDRSDRAAAANETSPDSSARPSARDDDPAASDAQHGASPAQTTADGQAAADAEPAEAEPADIESADAEPAQAKLAEAAASPECDHGANPASVDGIETLPPVDQAVAAAAPPPVTSELQPVPAVVIQTVAPPVAEAASVAAARDAADTLAIEAATAAGVQTDGAVETKGPTEHKPTPGAIAVEGGKRGATKAGDGAAATAATAGATDAEQDTVTSAAPQSVDKSEHAPAAASRIHRPDAAGKPAEGRAQVEPELSVAADKPTADAAQVVAPQYPAERATGVSNAAPGAAHASAAPNDQAAAVPIAGLALELAARAQAGRSRFEIRLDPPELGRIEVRLDVDRGGQVTSRLVVEKAETLDLLRRDASELERALQQAGLKTGDNSLQFTLRDQSYGGQSQDAADDSRAGAARLVVTDPEIPAVESLPNGYGRSLALGGGIDIRV
jgi:flagellar hook-length control protein FliK